MIVTILLGLITSIIVAIHGLAVWAGYHLAVQRSRLRKEDLIALGLLAASGLLHIINFTH